MMTAAAITRPCPACGATALAFLGGPQQRWRYLRCSACGHLTLEPMPSAEELTAYYNSVYSVPAEKYREATKREFALARRALGIAAGVGSRMLEIGCSYGFMLDAFRREGWTVEGVEIDARAAAHARDRLRLNVHIGPLEDVRAELHPPYHAVTMFHVLEHIVDPQRFLESVGQLLAPGGRLLLRTPNAGSVAARATGGWWEWCAAPEHVHLYTIASLEKTLVRNGFRVQKWMTRRGDAHGLLYELVRGGLRRALGRRNDERLAGAAPSPRPEAHRQGKLHRASEMAQGTLELLSMPIDVAMPLAAASSGAEIIARVTAAR